MRIRFLNTFVPVVPLYRDLFEQLRTRGHLVEALVAKQYYRVGEQRQHDSDEITYSELPTWKLPIIPSRVQKGLTHASYGVCAAQRLLSKDTADLNIFLTQPPLFHLNAPLMRAVNKTDYFVHIMDLYPWIGFKAGLLGRQKGLARKLEHLSVNSLKKARKLIAIGRCMKQRLIDLGIDPARIEVVTNWANENEIVPVERGDNPLLSSLELQDKFVVMYSGNMGVSHYFDDIIEVARRLQANREIVFLFQGSGSRLESIQQQVADLSLTNVRFRASCTTDELAQTLSLGDIHFISLRDGFEGLVVPSKAYGVMAAGRPMVYQGSARGEIAAMIREHGIGQQVEQGAVDQLHDQITHAYKDATWRLDAGRKARNLLETHYSGAVMTERYARAIESTV